MKNFLIKTALAFSLSALLTWLYLFTPSAFYSLDNRLRDFMFVMRGEIPHSNNIVIIDIDEKSLKKYGQWPWNRELISNLLYDLSDAGVGIVGLDIVFSEEDRSSPHKFQHFLKTNKNLPNYDKTLAYALSQTPVIGGYTFSFDETKEKNTPIIPAVFVKKGLTKDSYLFKPKGIVLNIPIIQDALYSAGFFNNIPDEGGMIRSVPLVMEYDDVLYPSLALEMLRVYSGVNRVDVVGDDSGVEYIKFGDFKIPTDHTGRLVANFRGGGKTFKYISAADVMSGDFNATDIQNKFALVGTSALALFDLRSNAYDSAMAGVEIHANVIDNILQGDYLRKPSDAVAVNIIMIWLIVFVFILIFSLIGSWLIIPAAIASILVLYQLLFMILFDYGYVLSLLFPLLAFVSTLIASVGLDYILESRQKDLVKRMLGKKVSPAVMEYLLEHSTEELVASKEVEASIFFSDIRGFTTISEKIGSPDKLIHMLNNYMTPMVDNVVNHHGTIDKFIGDAIMAYWNAPVPVKNHPDEAVKSAVEQINMLVEVNEKVTPIYDVVIEIGIGIHTGVVTAGDMGSEGRSDYTIIGDNVNLASRMEGL
ncbi:MAG: adenylate/guanylate cyclase domain-containing protein, partial [Thiovulaceae bacterium]|nr:adenylate/guanylate cyclase domain-containing protein [Sulfurimonadaceae bacterium]